MDATLRAVRVVAMIDGGAVASVIKHMIPCGLASCPAVAGAFTAIRDGDPVSALGGIIASTRDGVVQGLTVLIEVGQAREYCPGW